jgi:hypothetical protein
VKFVIGRIPMYHNGTVYHKTDSWHPWMVPLNIRRLMVIGSVIIASSISDLCEN